MSDEPHVAMRHAVDLAQTGWFNNWWVVYAQLRIMGYREEALNWSEVQREWLDRVCAEARANRLAGRGGASAT
jgi:hypothetical protein